AAGPGIVRPAGALYPGHPEPEAGPCAAGPPHRAGAGKALGPAGPLPLVRGRTGAAHRPAGQQRGAAVLWLLPLPRLPLHPRPVTGFLPQRGAKAPRSRGNPFLTAAQDRNTFPLALLLLADFRGAPRWALAKTGALRQPRLRCFVHWTRLARLPPGDKIER